MPDDALIENLVEAVSNETVGVMCVSGHPQFADAAFQNGNSYDAFSYFLGRKIGSCQRVSSPPIFLRQPVHRFLKVR